MKLAHKKLVHAVLPEKENKKSKPKQKRDMREGKKPFVRGYAPIRRILERGTKYTRSCYNCEYFYQAPGDDTEVCQNGQVLKYDMVVTESSIYCHMWRLNARRTDAKSLFRKGGK